VARATGRPCRTSYKAITEWNVKDQQSGGHRCGTIIKCAAARGAPMAPFHIAYESIGSCREPETTFILIAHIPGHCRIYRRAVHSGRIEPCMGLLLGRWIDEGNHRDTYNVLAVETAASKGTRARRSPWPSVACQISP